MVEYDKNLDFHKVQTNIFALKNSLLESRFKNSLFLRNFTNMPTIIVILFCSFCNFNCSYQFEQWYVDRDNKHYKTLLFLHFHLYICDYPAIFWNCGKKKFGKVWKNIIVTIIKFF